VSLNNTISDLLTITNGVISADDAGADRIFFWDESQGKATHLSVGTGMQITDTTLNTTIAAGKTYTLDAVDSDNDVILRLSDGTNNDDVKITSGSNITINPVSSGGFTISAASLGTLGGISDVTVVQTSYTGTNPITVTEPNATTSQINIPTTSNAYGRRFISQLNPSSSDGNDGDIWYRIV
jgi:hypothetical protein